MAKEMAIEVQGLHKNFGDVYAVKGVQFTVERGEILSLLGPNGAGKSTTISMLSCLLEPTQGDAVVLGHSVTKSAQGVKAALGVVPQDIALAAIYSSFSGTDDNRRINEAAARSIVQAEVDAIENVAEDCLEVKQLVDEGFDVFFARRSLAFSDMDVDNARAILIADREDEEAEATAAAKEKEPEMKTVTVDYPKDFDPLKTVSNEIPILKFSVPSIGCDH